MRAVVLLHATSRPAGDYDAEPHRWTVEAATYDDAFAQIERELPDGHVLLHVQGSER